MIDKRYIQWYNCDSIYYNINTAFILYINQMKKQNKEELIKEKQALVSQFNILQEKLNSYPISIIVNDN